MLLALGANGYGPISALAQTTVGTPGLLTKNTAAALGRLLGPAADEVAEALRRHTAFRVGNVQRIVEAAEKKYIGPDGGSVPPRLALQLLEQGSYTDEDIVVEYLSGVLASSPTQEGRDDAGVPWTALVARLSTVQLRLHYTLYTAAREALTGYEQPRKDGSSPIPQACGEILFVPSSTILTSLELSGEIDAEGNGVWEAFLGLQREGLVAHDYYGFGDGESMSAFVKKAIPSDGGAIFQPTVAGVALYMWGHGRGRRPLDEYLAPTLRLGLVNAEINVDPTGTALVRNLPQYVAPRASTV